MVHLTDYRFELRKEAMRLLMELVEGKKYSCLRDAMKRTLKIVSLILYNTKNKFKLYPHSPGNHHKTPAFMCFMAFPGEYG